MFRPIVYITVVNGGQFPFYDSVKAMKKEKMGWP